MRFSLRTLLLAVTLIAVWLGLYNWFIEWAPVKVGGVAIQLSPTTFRAPDWYRDVWLNDDLRNYWIRYHIESACLATIIVCCLITAVRFVIDIRRNTNG